MFSNVEWERKFSNACWKLKLHRVLKWFSKFMAAEGSLTNENFPVRDYFFQRNVKDGSESSNPPTSDTINSVSLFNTPFLAIVSRGMPYQQSTFSTSKVWQKMFPTLKCTFRRDVPLFFRDGILTLFYLSLFISIYCFFIFIHLSIGPNTTTIQSLSFPILPWSGVWRGWRRIGYCCAMYMYWVFSCHRHFDRGWQLHLDGLTKKLQNEWLLRTLVVDFFTHLSPSN